MNVADQAIADRHVIQEREAMFKRSNVVSNLANVIRAIRADLSSGFEEHQILDIRRRAFNPTRQHRLTILEGIDEQVGIRQRPSNTLEFAEGRGCLGKNSQRSWWQV